MSDYWFVGVCLGSEAISRTTMIPIRPTAAQAMNGVSDDENS